MLLVIALVVSSGPVLAQNGWYVGMDLGGSVTPTMDVKTGGADDWVSSAAAAHSAIRCDKTINPDGFQVEEGACGNAPSTWGPMDESFDGGKGLLAGLALGYRRGAFRAEGEYFYRSAAHESTDVPYDAATNYDPGTDPGFQTVMDGVDAVLSHNVFDAPICQDTRSGSLDVLLASAEIGHDSLIDLASEKTFQAPDDLPFGAALRRASGDVINGRLMVRFCCNFGPATSGWTVFDNDWTGSPIMPSDNPFKWRHFEPGLILLCVRWYLRYAVSYRDLEALVHGS